MANSELPEDVEVRVATHGRFSVPKFTSKSDTVLAAQDFVESYYPALNNPSSRGNLSTFYLKPSPTCKVDISLNGTVIPDPAAFQTLFENDVKRCSYEVQSFDCHVLNANSKIGFPEGDLGPSRDGKKMSIVVMVNGSVKYGTEDGDSDARGFTDNLVLVPNWDAQGPKASKGGKRWLIQNQTFRLVV